MNIALVTFDGFNEIDTFVALTILNRVKRLDWKVQIVSPTEQIISMNAIAIQAQQPLAFANNADVVLFGSGLYTQQIIQNPEIIATFQLDSTKQLIGSQCSGALILARLGLLHNRIATTDLTTRPHLTELGVEVCDRPFVADGNIATAGGCLAAQYLAGWVISRCLGNIERDKALQSVAPVGEQEAYLSHVASILEPEALSLTIPLSESKSRN